MVYLIGMSHAINIARAFSPEQFTISHDNWLKDQSDSFCELTSSNQDISIQKLFTAIIGGSGFVAGEFIENDRSEIKVHPQLLKLLKSIQVEEKQNMIFSALGGNEHSTLSMIQHPVPYDFVIPTHQELQIIKGCQILPYHVIESQILNSIKLTFPPETEPLQT